MKESIYLVGQISVDNDETYEWRYRVRKYFYKSVYVKIIDPCNNGFNQNVKSEAKGNDPDRMKVYHSKGADLLVPKDKSYVKRSTIGMANLNVYDHKKLIIGSFFELAWYIDCPEKSVVGIFSGDHTNSIICMHPFVRRAVDIWVQNEIEACEIIERFYINYV